MGQIIHLDKGNPHFHSEQGIRSATVIDCQTFPNDLWKSFFIDHRMVFGPNTRVFYGYCAYYNRRNAEII